MGLGTYLGHLNDETDAQLADVTASLLEIGINHFDTAPNYRAERSEAVLGSIFSQEKFQREKLFIGTKVGFLPFQRHFPKDPVRWIQEQYIETGILKAEEILHGIQCFSPEWISYQLDQSLKRLGCNYVDILYLHNLEVGFSKMNTYERERLVRRSFARLRELHSMGKLLSVGVASWGGFIGEGQEQISLEVLRSWAEKEDCAKIFRYLQAPFSISMPNALLSTNQKMQNQSMSLARAVAESGMHLVSSAPLFHGKLAEIELPDAWQDMFPDFSVAQTCLAMAFSAPGISSTLVGVKTPEHLAQFKKFYARPPISTSDFLKLVRS